MSDDTSTDGDPAGGNQMGQQDSGDADAKQDPGAGAPSSASGGDSQQSAQ